jgi:PAS domain S-box-containing protein
MSFFKTRKTFVFGFILIILVVSFFAFYSYRDLRITARLFILTAGSSLFVMAIMFWLFYRNLKAREKVQNHNLYLANLTENASDAIISLDRDGIIQSWNKAAENMYGFKKEEVVGKFAPALTQSGFDPEMIKEMGENPESKGLLNHEILQFRKDGTKVYCMASTTPVRNEKNELLGFVTVVRDITERKSLEEKLRLFNKELARQVEEQTATLRKLNEQLALSNRDLEQFAYVASHDLQEPLRMISSFLQLLSKKYEGRLDETGKEYISVAVDGAHRMKKLIDDLLDYSRVGRKEIHKSDVDLQVCVQRSLLSLGPAIRDAGAKIHVNPLPVVKGDNRQMEQVFQNIVGNALKYRRNVAPEITVGYHERENEWEIYVRDNGIGFDQEQAASIFNVFHRLHSQKEFSGTGIGLAICKKIIEGHGGRIRAESVAGEGSTFYFTLPKEA